MHLPTRSSLLHYARIYQLITAIGFLVLVCWCGVHRSWWDNIDGPLAIGVIAAVLTFIHSVFSIVTYRRNINPLSGSTIKKILRVAIEVVLLLVYIASAGLMLRPKTGCVLGPPPDNNLCYRPSNTEVLEKPVAAFDDQPRSEWNAAIALCFLEIISFIGSVFLVLIQDNSSKLGGGASFA